MRTLVSMLALSTIRIRRGNHRGEGNDVRGRQTECHEGEEGPRDAATGDETKIAAADDFTVSRRAAVPAHRQRPEAPRLRRFR